MRRCATATVTNSTAAIATVNALLIIALSPIGQMGLKLEIQLALVSLRELHERLYDTSHTPRCPHLEAGVGRKQGKKYDF